MVNQNGVVSVPTGGDTMPTTLTLKNIPDTLYEALKRSAEKNRRSLNNEAIHCLETLLRPNRRSIEETLAEIRRLRALQEGAPPLTNEEIDDAKREGRP